MVRLVRPVIVTALGESGWRAGELLHHWLPSFPQPVAIVAVSSGVDKVPEIDIPTVPAEEMRERIEILYEQGADVDALHVHWICLAAITGNDRDQVRSMLLENVIPMAAQLHDESRPLVFTTVLLDGSVRKDEFAQTLLKDIASAVGSSGIAASTQVYVFRALMETGFALNAQELVEAGALAAESLVLTNLRGAEFPLDMTRANPQNAIVLDANAVGLRIFGRMAVQSIRSLDVEVSDLAASIRMREFCLDQADRTALVTPLWNPHLVQVSRPELSDETSARIGARIRGGPRANFAGAPSLLEEPEAELQRIADQTKQWIQSIGAWQRQVRIEFARVLGELRDASAGERNEARQALNYQAMNLWQDQSTSHPIPHLREWIRRQDVSFEEDRRTQHTQAFDLRLDTYTDAQAALQHPLQKLQGELAKRPNVSLIVPLALLVLVGGIAVTWETLSNLRELAESLPWLEPVLGYDIALLQFVACIVLCIVVLAAVGSSIWDAHVRWRRAYKQLSDAANGITRREVGALEREIKLVDSHWYLKTIASSQRHLGKIESRLQRLETQLARPRLRRGDEVERAGRLIRYTPDLQVDARSELENTLEMFPPHEVARYFRSPYYAETWVDGDVDHWLREAFHALRKAFLQRRQDHHDRIDAEIQQTIQGISETWLTQSGNFLVPEYRHDSFGVTYAGLMFGSGVLGRLASQGEHVNTIGTPILFESDRDEILLCNVQMGLTAESVLS